MIKETIIKQLNNVLFSKKKCFISIALVPSSKPFLCAKEDIMRMQFDFISHCKLSLSVHTVRIYDANAPVINVANKAR